jgi:hypothetical protein
MPDPIDINHIHELTARLDKRMIALANDEKYVDKKMQSIQRDGDHISTDFKTEMERLSKDIKSIRGELHECMTAMTRLSKELKQTLKKEQLEQLNAVVDQIPFEQFITRTEIQK